MASSWNKGTLVSEADAAIDLAVASASKAVQEGKSLFQSVVEDAAEKLAQGAEVVANTKDPLTTIQDTAQAAGEFVYDLLPESDDVIDAAAATVETVGGALGTAQDKIVEAGQAVQDFGTSEFRFLLSNFFQAGTTLTEKDFNSTDIETLKAVVKRAKAEGRSAVDYKDFGSAEGEVLKGSPLAGLFDPDLRMARTIGGFQFSENEKGETIITNTYNFNAGPKRKAFWSAKKEGNSEEALNVLLSAASNPVELASIIAYAKQEELREAGEQYESELVLNLGVL